MNKIDGQTPGISIDPDPTPVSTRPGVAYQAAEKALLAVIAERQRQDAKWGEQNHDPFTYITILMEEVGELSQAALHARFGGDPGKNASEKMHTEAVHTAAVALAIVECLERGKWRWAS